MRGKSVVLLLLALGCGLVASIGISQMMDRGAPPPANNGETEPIFVALVDLNANDLLNAQVLKLEEWPKGKIPNGALTKLEQIDGKRCKQKLYAGEPILQAKIRGSEEDVLPSDGIPQGFRVVSVRTDSVSGTGLIVPGDRVDVLVFLNKNPSTGVHETSARTILQDIKVYAVDATYVGKQDSDGHLVSGKTVSLLVTPGQAEKVTLASEMGSIRLIIRSPADNAESNTDGASVADIYGGTDKNFREQEQKPGDGARGLKDLIAPVAPPPPPPIPAPVAVEPPPSSWKMILLEGSTLREVSFPQGDDDFPLKPAATSGDPAATGAASPPPVDSKPADAAPQDSNSNSSSTAPDATPEEPKD